MKNLYFIFVLALIFFNLKVEGQILNFSVSATAMCGAATNAYGSAGLTGTIAGAGSYSWNIASPASCTIQITNASPNGFFIDVSYGCTGVYSITCSAFTSGPTPTLITSVTQTMAVTTASNPVVAVLGNTSVCQYNWVALTASGAMSYTWQPGNLTSVSITPTQNSNSCYTVTGRSTDGCTNTTVHCVSVNANPTLSLVGNTNICAGQSGSYTVAGASSYTWFAGTQTLTGNIAVINPTASTCFSVIGANSSGCIGVAGACMVVQSTPTINISGPVGLCSGLSTTITASGASSYTWNVLATGASIIVSPTVPTCYTVIGQSAAGCTNTAVKCLTISTNPTITVNSGLICTGSPFTFTANGANSYTWLPGFSTGNTLPLTPTASACYTVYGMGTNGCATVTSACFSVMPQPVIAIVASTNNICTGSQLSMTAIGANSYSWYPGSFVGNNLNTNPITNGCYTLVGISANNCTNTSTFCYSVQPLPTLSVVMSTNTVCSSDPLIMTAVGANSYTWLPGFTNNSSVLINPTANGCYTVYGIDNNGCGNVTNTCFSVLPTPPLLVTGNNSVCLGTSTTFTASGANNYVWSNNVSGPTLYVLPITNTTYSVIGTDLNGCSTLSVITITVNSNCSDVWPGDANSDGAVGTLDVLELGLAASGTGPGRSPGGNNFVAQYAANWTGTVSSGKNSCHADCNGDGLVDANDTLAIFNNFSQTHSFKPSPASADPQITIVTDNNTAYEGQWNKADILIDNSNATGQLYGVAFDINFDNSLIENNSVYIVYTSSFLDAGNQNIIFRKTAFNNNKIYAATVRTNGSNVTGNGKIAEFYFKVKSGVPANSILNLSLSNANKINNIGLVETLDAKSTAATISNDLVGISNKSLAVASVNIYPNPANEKLNIDLLPNQTATYSLADVSGRILMVGSVVYDEAISLENLSAGTYFIAINVEGNISNKKVVIEK